MINKLEELEVLEILLKKEIGGKFNFKRLLNMRGTFITRDFLNRLDNVGNFEFKQDDGISLTTFEIIIDYMELYFSLHYKEDHSLFLKHVNGFLIIDTNRLLDINNIMPQKVLKVYVLESDGGIFIGTKGSDSLAIKNRINTFLKGKGTEIVFIKVLNIK